MSVLRATILLLNRSRAEQNHEREDREEGDRERGDGGCPPAGCWFLTSSWTWHPHSVVGGLE